MSVTGDSRAGGGEGGPRLRIVVWALVPAVLTLFLALGTTADAAAQSCPGVCIGPPAGSLVLAGGGDLDPTIYHRFVQLAGGLRARIVVVPTAARENDFGPDWPGLEPFREAGAASVTLLHTRRRDVAATEAFVEPIRHATGVWFVGGRPWRLVDAYLGTPTEDEIHRLLDRNGVVGGTSAGASIMASFLLRGAVEDNDIVVDSRYATGFGFLKGVAVDQHVIARDRQVDMLKVLRQRPDLLGIGLDEGTAIVVRGNRAEVVGTSRVAFYDPRDRYRLFRWLAPGEVYDLARRTPHEPALHGTGGSSGEGPSGN